MIHKDEEKFNNELEWLSKYFTKANLIKYYMTLCFMTKRTNAKKPQTAQMVSLTCFLWPDYKEFW